MMYYVFNTLVLSSDLTHSFAEYCGAYIFNIEKFNEDVPQI